MALGAIYVSYFLVQMSMKGNSMLASLYSVALGAGTTTVGVIIACYSLMPLLCSIWTGRLCDRIGNRLPVCLGALCCSGALLVPGVIRGRLFAVVISQLLFGLGHVMFQLSVQDLLGKCSDRQNRAERFGILSVIMAVGNMMAPLMVGRIIDHKGFSPSYLLCSVFSLVAFIIMLLSFRRPGPMPGGAPAESGCNKGYAFELLRDRDRQKMLLTSATIMTGTTLFSFYIPLYGNQIGFTATQIGVLSSSYAAAFFVVRVIFPALTRRWPGTRVLQGALLLSAAGYLLLPLIKAYYGLAAVCFVIGLGLGCGNPLTMNIAYQIAPPGRSGEVIGLRLMTNRLTQLLLPAVTGAIFPSYALVFWGLGAFLGGSSFVYSGAPKPPAADNAPERSAPP